MVEPDHVSDEVPSSAPHGIDYARPLPAGDDPFCQAPKDFEATAPGTVLRSREIRLAFLGIIPQAVVAYQLLYRTTDLDGGPQAAITTVIRPAGITVAPDAPVISYQCAIDAVASTGFPSYVLRHHATLAKVFGGPPAWEYVPMARR